MGAWGVFLAVGLLGGQAIVSTTDVEHPVVPAPESVVATPPAEGFVRLAALTPIELEIVDSLSSKTSLIDARFTIRVKSPVMVDGRVIIPAGVEGMGQVVHAAKARALGKAGELILAARHLDCGSVRIPLRGFKFSMSGKDKTNQTMWLTAAFGAPFALMSGGDLIVPPGTYAAAKLAGAIDLRPGGPDATCIAPAGYQAPVAAEPIVVAQPVAEVAPAQGVPAATAATVQPK